jgi:hypothetical protein
MNREGLKRAVALVVLLAVAVTVLLVLQLVFGLIGYGGTALAVQGPPVVRALLPGAAVLGGLRPVTRVSSIFKNREMGRP